MSLGRKTGKSEKTVSISTVSTITEIEVYTLRYWEREFSEFLNPPRSDGGQRRYRPEDIQMVFTLKRLLRDEMFSIAGARRYLKNQFKNAA
jgi:DNA-binding transcriptional MerR regulator